MKFSIGSDHRGVDLKSQIAAQLAALGHQATDVGTHDTQSVDYPDIAASVGEQVSRGEVDRGLLICGSGIGMSAP